jgi:hypothetical protein
VDLSSHIKLERHEPPELFAFRCVNPAEVMERPGRRLPSLWSGRVGWEEPSWGSASWRQVPQQQQQQEEEEDFDIDYEKLL